MHFNKRKAVSVLCWISLMTLCMGFWACPTAGACGWNSDVKLSAENLFWDQLVERAAAKAWQIMGGKPSASNAIALTNAGYAMIDGYGTAACLDSLMDRTGATPGKMTLIDVHSSKDGQFWLFFYDRRSGAAVYLEPDHDVVASLLTNLTSNAKRNHAKMISVADEALFSFVGSGKFKPSTMFAAVDGAGPQVDEYEANLIQTGSAFNGNEFRIMGIVLAIVSNAPTDVMRSIQFHDHYCPGVTSGIMVVRYIEKNFPDYASFVFSVPPWCKDDAFMVMLNKTPGKSGYAVTYLTDEDEARLDAAYSTIAGVFFGKNSDGVWEGKVVGFDFNRLSVTVGSYSSWQTKLKMDEEYLKYLDAPETFVSVLKTITLPAGKSPSDYARPGVDQLEAFGLVSAATNE